MLFRNIIPICDLKFLAGKIRVVFRLHFYITFKFTCAYDRRRDANIRIYYFYYYSWPVVLTPYWVCGNTVVHPYVYDYYNIIYCVRKLPSDKSSARDVTCKIDETTSTTNRGKKIIYILVYYYTCIFCKYNSHGASRQKGLKRGDYLDGRSGSRENFLSAVVVIAAAYNNNIFIGIQFQYKKKSRKCLSLTIQR